MYLTAIVYFGPAEIHRTAMKLQNWLVLLVTNEAADKLAGLGLGADDYIAKPFLPQEFLLRIYAVLRRCYKEDEPILKLHSKIRLFRFGGGNSLFHIGGSNKILKALIC